MRGVPDSQLLLFIHLRAWCALRMYRCYGSRNRFARLILPPITVNLHHAVLRTYELVFYFPAVEKYLDFAYDTRLPLSPEPAASPMPLTRLPLHPSTEIPRCLLSVVALVLASSIYIHTIPCGNTTTALERTNGQKSDGRTNDGKPS